MLVTGTKVSQMLDGISTCCCSEALPRGRVVAGCWTPVSVVLEIAATQTAGHVCKTHHQLIAPTRSVCREATLVQPEKEEEFYMLWPGTGLLSQAEHRHICHELVLTDVLITCVDGFESQERYYAKA